MKLPFNRKRYERLENNEGSEIEKQVKKKNSFLNILNKDSKNISEVDISSVNLLLENKTNPQDFNVLVSKVRPIRMWVRENKEHLTNINSSIEDFEEIASNAKLCRENAQTLISIQMYEGSVVETNIRQYRDHVKKEMEIARKLYDYIHQKPSGS